MKMIKISRIFKQTMNRNYSTIQYISDLHVDHMKIGKIPVIEAKSKYLAICGDIGLPSHPNFNAILKNTSTSFEKVFIALGNHDFGLGCCYEKESVKKWTPYIQDICSKYDNIILLNKSSYNLENYIFIGTTLWSNAPSYNIHKQDKYQKHINEHKEHLNWIKQQINNNNNKQIIVLTHFPPTYKLIEEKYKKDGQVNGWYASDYDNIIKSPIKAWLCGHTHSILNCNINGVYCGVNALGYPNEKIQLTTKIVNI